MDSRQREENELLDSEKRYWWLNANPRDWSFSEIEVGESVEWTLFTENGNKRRVFQNFLDAKEGEWVIGYECTPVKKIVALCKVSKENDGDFISFEKVEDLRVPVYLEEIKEIEGLKQMEYLINPQGSFFRMTKEEYRIVFEKIKEKNPAISLESTEVKVYTKEDFLREVYFSLEELESLCGLLRRKKNIILQGAPGVGKTFMAKRLAYAMIGDRDESRVANIQFHQSYSYEDFVMGYRPYEDGFRLEYGIFYDFCKRAQKYPKEEYFFIIDEINRGNLSKIFGELLMLIENDKRGEKLLLAYSKKYFSVPPNLYIIGMMNTADRSLATMDYALRRRFSFYKMKPAFEREEFRRYQRELGNERLDAVLEVVKELNQEIIEDSSLGEGFVIGHSYFCGEEYFRKEWLEQVVEYDLIPILEEYWFDNPRKLKEWEEKLKEAVQE